MAKERGHGRRRVWWTLSIGMLVGAACGSDEPAAGPDEAAALLDALSPQTVVIERSDSRDFRAPDDPPAVTLALAASGELTVWDEAAGELRTTTLPDGEVASALVSLWDGAPQETDHLDDNEFVQHCIEGLDYLDSGGESVQILWDCGPPPGELDAVIEVVEKLRAAGA